MNRLFIEVVKWCKSWGIGNHTEDAYWENAMNSSVRIKPLPPGEEAEDRTEKLRRIKEQMSEGFYSRTDVLKDVADALIMNPEPFENLNEKES